MLKSAKKFIPGLIFFSLIVVLHACTVPAPPAPPNRTNPLDTASQQYIPDPPYGLSARTYSDTAVELQWYDVSLAEIEYIVSRRDVTLDTVFDTLAVLPPNSTSYVDHAVPPSGAEFVYAVAVMGKAGLASSSYVTVTFPYRSLGTRGSAVTVRSRSSIATPRDAPPIILRWQITTKALH